MRILIVGAGYVGSACARTLVKSGHEVFCLVHSAASATRLSADGLKAQTFDAASEESWLALDFKAEAALYCPSTRGGEVSDYLDIHQIGLNHALRHLPCSTKFFYTSSTSVYGQADGSAVDEMTSPCPVTEKGRILIAAEKCVIARGGIVLRLAGIYGPGRSLLLGRFQEGTALFPANPDRHLNLIHRDDIVSAFVLLLHTGNAGGELFNVTDDRPSSYAEIYDWLAARLKRPLPPEGVASASGRGLTDKTVSNKKLRARGWVPEYPDFRAGFEALLKQDSSRR